MGVTNLIAVRPSLPAQELKEEIETALGRCADLNARRIVVEVDNACVRLWGCVSSLAQRETAERAAWSAPESHACVIAARGGHVKYSARGRESRE